MKTKPGMQRASARASHIALAHMLRVMMEGPSNTEAIADACGITPNTVRKMIRVFRREGVAHIAAWEGVKNPLYALALNEPDAKKPKAKDRLQVVREYRARRSHARMLNILRPKVTPENHAS